MIEKNTFIQDVGDGGRIRLPKEVMKVLDIGPGNQLKIEIRGEFVTIARHLVKDPFADAANKKAPGLEELFAKQESRKKEAAAEFDKRIQEKHEVRPEDREDFWR